MSISDLLRILHHEDEEEEEEEEYKDNSRLSSPDSGYDARYLNPLPSFDEDHPGIISREHRTDMWMANSALAHGAIPDDAMPDDALSYDPPSSPPAIESTLSGHDKAGFWTRLITIINWFCILLVTVFFVVIFLAIAMKSFPEQPEQTLNIKVHQDHPLAVNSSSTSLLTTPKTKSSADQLLHFGSGNPPFITLFNLEAPSTIPNQTSIVGSDHVDDLWSSASSRFFALSAHSASALPCALRTFAGLPTPSHKQLALRAVSDFLDLHNSTAAVLEPLHSWYNQTQPRYFTSHQTALENYKRAKRSNFKRWLEDKSPPVPHIPDDGRYFGVQVFNGPLVLNDRFTRLFTALTCLFGSNCHDGGAYKISGPFFETSRQRELQTQAELTIAVAELQTIEEGLQLLARAEGLLHDVEGPARRLLEYMESDTHQDGEGTARVGSIASPADGDISAAWDGRENAKMESRLQRWYFEHIVVNPEEQEGWLTLAWDTLVCD